MECVEIIGSQCSDFIWLARARSKDAFRDNLQCLNFTYAFNNESLVGVATDGHRIHIVKRIIDVGEGSYRIHVLNKNKVILIKTEPLKMYPDCSQYILDTRYDVLSSKKAFANICDDPAEVHYAKIVKAMPDKQSINFKYYLDIIEKVGVFNAYIFNDLEPVMFDTSYRRAFIMPILDEE